VVLGCSDLVVAQKGPTPPIIRLDTRMWNLPIDAKVGTVVSRLTISDHDTHKDNITVSFSRVLTRIGPFHDGSQYFQTYPVKHSQQFEQKFDIELARLLQPNFKVGDQLNLYITAHDGQYHSKNEVYVRLEEARNRSSRPALPPLPPPTTTRTVTPSVSIVTSSAVSPTPSTAALGNSTVTTSDSMGPGVTITFVIVPVLGIGILAGLLYRCRSRVVKVSSCCLKSDKSPSPEGVKKEIDNVLSTETEFTDLASSRKTSMALSTFSYGSQYSEPPDALTKQEWDRDRDPWEFPRHHLKIYGILGEGCFGQVWKCEALNIDGVKGTSTVAVKTLKESASEKEKKDLLAELEVMKMLRTHPNVVRLIGCCTQGSEKSGRPNICYNGVCSKGETSRVSAKIPSGALLRKPLRLQPEADV